MNPLPSLPLRPQFTARLEAARALAFSFFRGSVPHTAPSGAPAEFEGHRPYLPGDDTRWIDWNLFARLEELYVKVFEVEEELEVIIMTDFSPSMFGGDRSKHRVAAAAAAAFAYLALITGHPVTVARYAGTVIDRVGPFRHLQSHSDITRLLSTPGTGEGTDLEQSLGPLFANQRRPVTVVALSDGFQRSPLEGVAAFHRGESGRRFIFCRVSDARDLQPSLRGNIILRDPEGTDTISFLSDRTLEKQLLLRITNYFRKLEASLLRAGMESLQLPTAGEFEENFIKLLLLASPLPAVAVPAP